MSRKSGRRTNADEMSERRGPLVADIHIPAPGELVPWTAHLRADVPDYVADQLREVAHRSRCTVTSLLVRIIALHCDPQERRVFVVRREDLMRDRRRRKANTKT